MLCGDLCASAEQDFDGFAVATKKSKNEDAPPQDIDGFDVSPCFDEKIKN